ncbi:hypothetical protein SAMN04515691_2988 [Leifsonia sp. 98AMF]|uniref:hypothetical protein n=1 Tax=unclassified Leifsonia TaxID=2663824 RepID=UPI00087A8959|nr:MULTISPECIES: hypothetical protein [unclassified Leifsonia]SDH16096.1 hypothetical protein SAMN04515690_1028 [Leifsonia sp. 197AMF]SDJ22177.1 hypothetical protein SAMN04515684_2754 [Leifsonia sp. 466MF]SDK61546.1 hypothetical protein SAMN04515683_4010 [Leifsonia sp. 157MF]SDN43865.1 hypothetical protein SAMN04515686_0938 [Leifsonia sp. 509MF]SEN67229.1 hypothetical protein SAMN04515685_3991 [Leifsonia sp. 467MF]
MAEDSTAPAATDLSWYVQAIGEDKPYAESCQAEAQQMVDDFIGEGNPFGVPESVVARAVLEVGADLYYRKASRNGVVQLDGVEPQLFRLNRDPMAAAYPLLRRYLVMGL